MVVSPWGGKWHRTAEMPVMSSDERRFPDHSWRDLGHQLSEHRKWVGRFLDWKVSEPRIPDLQSPQDPAMVPWASIPEKWKRIFAESCPPGSQQLCSYSPKPEKAWVLYMFPLHCTCSGLGPEPRPNATEPAFSRPPRIPVLIGVWEALILDLALYQKHLDFFSIYFIVKYFKTEK